MLPAYTGKPGVYTIRPSSLSFAADTNYAKSYIDGLLYVSSGEQELKPIVIRLACVQSLHGDKRSKYKYLAYFYYENKNSMPVNIPIGANNKIISSGPYKGEQPSVFNPGLHYVTYYFNGKRLTWRVRTGKGKGKKAVSHATASSSSPKCNEERTESSINNERSINKKSDIDIEAVQSDKLYPNPATNTLWVVTKNSIDNPKGIIIISASGVMYQPKIKSQSGQAIEIDISALQKGVYFIRIKDKDQFKTLSFIKL